LITNHSLKPGQEMSRTQIPHSYLIIEKIVYSFGSLGLPEKFALWKRDFLKRFFVTSGALFVPEGA
jgi:hypothetical protein